MAVDSLARKSVVLELIRIQRETHNCATFRFRPGQSDLLQPRPGQFMTFTWLLNGRKINRSFTISSSPTQRGYIEITVKKNPEGLVSAFLNDQAQIGLTVEAHGPSGKFYFDENQHKRIVLIAAGSGITPMMAILRYIDDLSLDIETTLFYSVRTREDIIFDQELRNLEHRLPRFRPIIVQTRASDDTQQSARHLTADIITENLTKPDDQTYFLCGPASFIDSIKVMLAKLGIAPQQILQESFGGITRPALTLATTPASTLDEQAVRRIGYYIQQIGDKLHRSFWGNFA